MMRWEILHRCFGTIAVFLCLSLLLHFAGCSRGDGKKDPEKEKPVVTDMNIKTTSMEESSESKNADSDEAEQPKEDEQPLLTPQK